VFGSQEPWSLARRARCRAAERCGVNLTTFDTESELFKLARWHAGARLLLRIRADDPLARCPLGNKFGAEVGDAARLLRTAADLGLAVVGCSFHVGSGATDTACFGTAINLARKVRF
jgi:ornithine decarboxylase